MGAKSDHFCPFSAYLGVFPPVLLMEYRIFISIVDISSNFKNIGIDIDIDKEILENIDIDINIDKEIWENIDIDKISNRLEFGISNRATELPVETDPSLCPFSTDPHSILSAAFIQSQEWP